MKLTDFAQAHEFRIPLFWILSCVAVVASQSGAGEVTLSGISDRQFQNVSNNDNQRNAKSEGQGVKEKGVWSSVNCSGFTILSL